VKSRLVSSTVLLVVTVALSMLDRRVSFTAYLLVQLGNIVMTTRTATGAPPTDHEKTQA
jgi:hypothetical protein